MIKRFNLYKEGSFKTDSLLEVRWLAPADLKHIETKECSFWKLFGEMTVGNRCLALIENGEVLSYLWVNDKFNQCYGIKEPLKRNECCLYNAVTKPDKRGKGYAEILRAKCYEILRKQGKDTFYSFTEQNNKSALKLKEKLGARLIESYLFVKLWKFKYLRHERKVI